MTDDSGKIVIDNLPKEIKEKTLREWREYKEEFGLEGDLYFD